MFRAIVSHRVRVAWQHIQRGDYEFVLDQLADDFQHSFAGSHALGGTRTSKESQRAWFGRLGRVLAGFTFDVQSVLVAGWPWRTSVISWIAVTGRESEPPYRNVVAQRLELRWGRITRIENLEDTQLLAGLLERLLAAGVQEAGAAPIDDRHELSRRQPAGEPA